jgi:hypothetical protein
MVGANAKNSAQNTYSAHKNESKPTTAQLDQYLFEVNETLLAKIKVLEEKVVELQKKSEIDSKIIQELKSKLEQPTQSETINGALDFSKLNWAKDKAGLVILSKVNKEISDKSKKESNIIISGCKVNLDNVANADRNKALLNAILPVVTAAEGKIDESQVKRVVQLKQNESNDSKILVEFKNKSDRDLVLKNRIKLAAIEMYKGKVFINPDLTASERATERDLRLKRKEKNDQLSETVANSNFKYGRTDDGKLFYWGIRDGALKKIIRKD